MTDFSYNTATRVLQPGDESHFDVTGTYVQVVAANHSDFGVRLDGGALNYWDKGIVIGGSETDLPFRQVTLVNEGATALTVTLAYGRGDFADRRVSFTGGALPIEFASPQPVTQSGAWAVSATFPAAQAVTQGGNWTVQPITFAAPQPVTQSGNFTVQPITFAAPQPVTQSGNFTVQPITFAAPQGVVQGDPANWRDPAPVLHQTNPLVTIGAGSQVFLIGGNPNNARHVVHNKGTETIWLRHDTTVVAAGLPVAPGEAVSLRTQAGVYGVNPSGVAVTVAQYTERWA